MDNELGVGDVIRLLDEGADMESQFSSEILATIEKLVLLSKLPSEYTEQALDIIIAQEPPEIHRFFSIT